MDSRVGRPLQSAEYMSRARFAVSRLMILAPRIRLLDAVAAEEHESLHDLFEIDHLF
jgi:hypothetical protein